jgi:hypothetical protein
MPNETLMDRATYNRYHTAYWKLRYAFSVCAPKYRQAIKDKLAYLSLKLAY